MDIENSPFENRLDISQLNHVAFSIREEIGKVIQGQERALDLLITALFANGHVLIEGVPGVAKTLIAKLLARSVNTGYSRIQFTPDLMPSDVLGTYVFNSHRSDFEFNAGPVFSNLILIDEVNRAPAKTQSALFEVMEERQVTVDGVTRKMDDLFMVMATQNPVEHEGTYRLPEAQLDRFLFKIKIDYPALDEETAILENAVERKSASELEQIAKVVSADKIVELQNMVNYIVVDPQLLRYITEISAKTRTSGSLYLGASPRASLSVLRASRAYAALEGRDFVTPQDVKNVILPVLVHRVILTPEKEMEGVTVESVIKQIVDSVEVPK
ncbi:MoxR family ATPase [Marinilabiliaceae bacterium ANBcel2]|nr:MoxR family ATPase [Marinilabiliaceae bacterium ANBcel2]